MWRRWVLHFFNGVGVVLILNFFVNLGFLTAWAMVSFIHAHQLPTPEVWWNAIEVFFVLGCLGGGTWVLLRNGPLLIKYDPLFYFAGIGLSIYCLTLVADQILPWMSAFSDAWSFFTAFLVIDLLLGLALCLVTYYKVKLTVEPFLDERERIDAAKSRCDRICDAILLPEAKDPLFEKIGKTPEFVNGKVSLFEAAMLRSDLKSAQKAVGEARQKVRCLAQAIVDKHREMQKAGERSGEVWKWLHHMSPAAANISKGW